MADQDGRLESAAQLQLCFCLWALILLGFFWDHHIDVVSDNKQFNQSRNITFWGKHVIQDKQKSITV